MLSRVLLSFSLAVATLGGCGPTYVSGTATATVSPRLVWVSPGIWVVEDQPYAIYYADGFYWRYDGGIWYRSTWYDGGFARVNVGIVPRIVVTSYRPRVHVRYRAPTHVRTRPIVRSRPVVRDHRRRR